MEVELEFEGELGLIFKLELEWKNIVRSGIKNDSTWVTIGKYNWNYNLNKMLYGNLN